jgi:hypothetical protein
MAKKRRKPRNRQHPATSSNAGAVTTAERSDRASTAPVLRTRADKKELARQRREKERRREDRARFIRIFVRLVAVSAVAAIVIYWFIRPDEEPQRPATLPGELTTEAPWPSNTAQMPARVEAIGLPPEGTTQHVHANLRIFVHGEAVPVPSGIGTTQDEVAALHTHDDQGTIHVESQTRRDFTLGEFLDVWGVRVSGTCLGGYCERDEDQLQAFVAGEEVTGSLRDVVLDDETVIVLTFGTPQELPDPIPSTFDFTTVPQ